MANDWRAVVEKDVIISFAGQAAHCRARRGSGPGWTRMLSWEQVKAYHESGHCVVALVLGRYVYELTIVPDRDTKVGVSGWADGLTCYGSKERGQRAPRLAGQVVVLDNDIKSAARYAFLLAPEANWKSGLRTLRALRARARDLIEQHWASVKAVALVLEVEKTLDQDAIGKILEGRLQRV